MLVGSAWEDITPKNKLPIMGQMRLRLGRVRSRSADGERGGV